MSKRAEMPFMKSNGKSQFILDVGQRTHQYRRNTVEIYINLRYCVAPSIQECLRKIVKPGRSVVYEVKWEIQDQ
jgi:hypothetical protein